MRRRVFIRGLGGAAVAAWPGCAVGQQQSRPKVIAVLEASSQQHGFMSFTRALASRGWKEGTNAKFEYRTALGDPAKAAILAKEVAALKPDVFLATNTQMVEALRQQASNAPIIFVQVPDPVGSGFVASLARPGGNITGFINFDASIGSKWLALLTEITRLKLVGVLLQSGNPTAKGFLQAITIAATTAGVVVVDANVFEPADIARAFDDFARRKVDAVIVPPSAMASIYVNSITSLSLTQRIPTLSTYREFVTAGGLMYYGYDRAALYEQAADYVDRILRGTKASQLPVQAPNKYELVINLATAKAMNLSVSDKMMALANEVIE